MDKKKTYTLFEKNGLARTFPLIEPLIKNCIQLSLKKTDENTLSIGQSKIGGLPDLPKSEKWFTWKNRSLSFIGQINFAEVKKFDMDDRLPFSGIAYFFYHAEQETWGFDPNDKGSFLVYYFDDDAQELERKQAPSDLDEYSIYHACQLSFTSTPSLPNPYEYDELEGLFSDEEDETYHEMINDGDIFNQMLGSPNNIQGEMRLECQLVTNGLFCGDSTGYEDPRAEELSKSKHEWTLLLQVDSNEDEAGMMWGDCGRIYFWIKEDDLKNKKFENIWMTLQCF